MDKIEQIEKRNNLIWLSIGVLLVLGLLLIYREGLNWFSITKWSNVSILSWVSISAILCIALLLQYYFLMLLRYSVIKYLVLWFIPVMWLFNNGIVAMHRFLNWTTDIVSPVGWIPVGDLIGWLLAAVFSPLLLGSGIVIAIIDSSSIMLTEACYYAGIALDITGVSTSSFVSSILNSISIFWDIVSNSFTQDIISITSSDRSLLELNLSHAFSLPYWVLSIGYSFTCILI